MKGRWRDNLNKFRRDNNVRWRGNHGRCSNREGFGFDSWNECGRGEKEFWGRYVHKAERRAIKAKLNNPQTIVDAYWELDLAWDDSWFEEETDAELAELGLNKFGGTTYIDLPLEDFDLNDLEHFDPRLKDMLFQLSKMITVRQVTITT